MQPATATPNSLYLQRFDAIPATHLIGFFIKGQGAYPIEIECFQADFRGFGVLEMFYVARRRVGQDLCHINFAFMVLKLVPTASLSWQFPAPFVDTLSWGAEVANHRQGCSGTGLPSA